LIETFCIFAIEIKQIDMKNVFKNLFLSVFLLCPFIVYAQEEAPQVTIIQPINGTVFSGEQIKVEYFVERAAPKSARILVDDKLVQLLSEVKIGQNTAMVDVPARDCKITVVVQNEFGASVPAAVNLKRSEFIFKPTLYLLAIGVSKYANSELHLQFAAKDAIDFAQTLLRQQGLLYEKVELKLLADENATADKIRDGLNWLQTETTYRDVAMIFMAGHGVNNNVGDFFFMPVNADIEKLNATCVGYREIKETLDANAGKIIVFMDACHSGNVLGNNQRRAAMLSQAITDLTGADNGAIVFTSSTGRQYSLENPEWNNGAFTKALLEGLNGKADLFDNKTITVNTLSSYVANRVKELTKGQQAPTTIIPSSVPDFPLAIVTVNVTINVDAPPPLEATTARKQPVYLSIAAGATTFGNYVPSKIQNSGATLFGVDVAYFFSRNIGAGAKLNVANSKVNFGGDNSFSYRDQVMFAGPALYARFGKNRMNFNVGAGVGALIWKLTDVKENNILVDNESYTSAGALLSAGVCFMFSQNIGVSLNVQSVIGTIKDQFEWERKPTGLGATIGIVSKF